MNKKQFDKMRDMETPNVFGHELDRATLLPVHRPLPPLIDGQDNGADPLGDGTFKMHPSGDIVDFAERNKRLGKL